jgi:hypothetical protein
VKSDIFGNFSTRKMVQFFGFLFLINRFKNDEIRFFWKMR